MRVDFLGQGWTLNDTEKKFSVKDTDLKIYGKREKRQREKVVVGKWERIQKVLREKRKGGGK